MKSIVMISNLPFTELEGLLGDRVIDRMREGDGTEISFDWQSYRDRVSKDTDLPVRDVAPAIAEGYQSPLHALT